MGNISWTKSYSASDNGSILGGADIQNLQNDITTVVNGGITDSNVNASAAIKESKLAFLTTGHTHNGTDASYPLIKHYRRGMTLKQGTDNEDIVVTPGVIDIGGKLFVTTANSANIDIVTGNWIDGNSRPASGIIYVYAYNNSGSIGYGLATEAPDLSDSSENAVEVPWRYQKYSSTLYRLLGIVHTDASSDLQVDLYNNFDLSNFACGSFTAVNPAANMIITTGWTPRYMKVWSPADTTPDTTDKFDMFETFEYGEKTADPHLGGGSATGEVTFRHGTVATLEHELFAEATAGNITDITQQAAGTGGSFTIYAPTASIAVYWTAWTDRVV